MFLKANILMKTVLFTNAKTVIIVFIELKENVITYIVK